MARLRREEVVVETVVAAAEQERRRTRAPRGGNVGWEAEMSQDASNHSWIVNERDQTKTASAARAVEHIESEAPGHQLRPEQIRSGRPRCRGCHVGVGVG